MDSFGRQMVVGLKPSRAVIVLLSINVAMVVVVNVLWYYFDRNSFLLDHLGLTTAGVVERYEVWQVFTYFWLHSYQDPGHVIWNLLTLWLFSGPLERHWGSARFVRFYITCGVGAGLVVLGWGLLVPAEDPRATVGASGAILGLVAAFGILFPRLPIYVFGVFPMKARTLAILFVVLSTLLPILFPSNVSVTAHIGGLAVGALLATGYWRPDRLIRRIQLARARRRLKVLEGGRDRIHGKGNGSGRVLH
jgi:membrane associated rhomboid family serine protease